MTMTIAGVTPEYTLTPIPSEHAMCYTDDAFPTYAYGSEACIWFVSETDEGWYVKSVKLNGTEITPDADGRYRFKVTSNIEITVETEQRVHTVTVVSGEHGTVTPASGEYIEGKQATLTVTPDEGYQVKSVTLDGKEVALTDGTYTFTVTADCTFEAVFEEIPKNSYTVTVKSGIGGSVTPGTKAYEEGSEVTLTVTPDSGYRVKYAMMNGKIVSLNSGTYTFTVEKDCVFEAVFAKKSSSGGSTGGSGSSRPARPSAEENYPSAGGNRMSWSNIAACISGLPEGGSIVIELNGETQVPEEVIRAVADRRIKAEFIHDSVRSWLIDGGKITAVSGADLTALPGNADRSKLRGVNGADLKVSGTKVPAELKLKFRKEYAGQFANVYRMNGGTPEFLRCVRVGEDGAVIIPGADTAGEYIVMACVYSDVPGDMNNDGALNASDASAILKAVIGAETGANPAMADINGDGRVNALDAAAILRMMIGGL